MNLFNGGDKKKYSELSRHNRCVWRCGDIWKAAKQQQVSERDSLRNVTYLTFNVKCEYSIRTNLKLYMSQFIAHNTE